MTIFFESDRLQLRSWSFPEDTTAAFNIYKDSEVTHFLPNLRTAAETEASLGNFFQTRLAILQSQNNGSNWWAIVEKNADDIVGMVLLQNLPDNHTNPTLDYEIGWHLKRASWGKGYATEAAGKIVNYGFEVLNLPTLYAVVHPENKRSVRVTQCLGMQPLGLTDKYYGMELLLFKLEKVMKS